MPCLHEKLRTIGVVQHAPMPGDLHRVTFAVFCAECSAELQFAANDGGIAFNDERTQLTAWVVEKIES